VVANYVEPFCGSAAMLLANPNDCTETINDINAWLQNAWRAIKYAPEETAKHASDWVAELDLHAKGDAIFYRDDWYQQAGHASVDAWVEWVRSDPEHYDARIAGWWVWGQSSWIGDNWGRSPGNCRTDAKGEPCGVVHGRPHLTRSMGVNRQLPHLFKGKGVNRKRLQGQTNETVVSLTDLADTLAGLDAADGELLLGLVLDRLRAGTTRQAAITAYFCQLAERLARVRVCCGDWRRVLGPCATTKLGTAAIFLDPPYGATDRDSCYGEHEDFNVAADVREWCLENGDNPLLRICLCGYEGEGHEVLEKRGWSVVAWKAKGGYSNQNNHGNDNAKRERLWFSPACVSSARLRQGSLLEEGML
jgi:hypothetical protein